ncbi:MAG: hypothetical protein QF497_07555, partial [Verrucomicrobiota bacterium]|nr:hypothetical protein [Verrucomicrobiota bacterium]
MDKNVHLATIHENPRALEGCTRVCAVLNGQMPDRVPFHDNYWPDFRERYLAEKGLPPDTDFREHFDHDFVVLAPIMGPWPSGMGETGR